MHAAPPSPAVALTGFGCWKTRGCLPLRTKAAACLGASSDSTGGAAGSEDTKVGAWVVKHGRLPSTAAACRLLL